MKSSLFGKSAGLCWHIPTTETYSLLSCFSISAKLAECRFALFQMSSAILNKQICMSLLIPTARRSKPRNGSAISLRKMIGVIGALLVALSWMQSASASCGNYLFRNGKPVSGHFRPMDSLNGVQAHELQADAGPLEFPVRRCSGPNCSSSPLPLAPVPAVPSNLIQSFDPAAILEMLVQSSETPRGIEIPQSERGACFEPSLIFRPPAV